MNYRALQEATLKRLVAKIMEVRNLKGELEVEREAGRIQRHKAISNYAEVRRLRAELAHHATPQAGEQEQP